MSTKKNINKGHTTIIQLLTMWFDHIEPVVCSTAANLTRPVLASFYGHLKRLSFSHVKGGPRYLFLTEVEGIVERAWNETATDHDLSVYHLDPLFDWPVVIRKAREALEEQERAELALFAGSF